MQERGRQPTALIFAVGADVQVEYRVGDPATMAARRRSLA